MAIAPPDDLNPFRAPTASIRPPTVGGEVPDAEAIRQIYLGHEAAVRSLGSLSYLVATLALIGVVVYGFGAFGVDVTGLNAGGKVGMTGLSATLAGIALLGVVIYGGMGCGLSHLQPWARWVTVVVAGLACLRATFWAIGAAIGLASSGPISLLLLFIPFFITAYILYLMLAAKATMVFSPAYRAVVRQTPQMAYRTSRGLKVALGLFVVLVVGAFVAVLNR